MKNTNKSYKPTRVIDSYMIKKQLHRGFRIVEVSHFSDESFLRKRTLYKNLSLTDAEDKLYRLESRLK